MKKNNYFTLVILVLILSVFSSCQKERGFVNKDNTDEIYTPEAMALWSKLNNFNQKIKSGLKSEELLSPDSAMWYLEALFNVQQATDTTFDDVFTYRRSYSLAVNESGAVSMSSVATVYNQMVADLQTELANIDSDHKFLIIADLQESTMKSGDFDMELIAGIGINPLIIYEPITTEDNWFYGNMIGRCDSSYFGQSDAGQELKRRFNNPKMELPFPHNAWINPISTGVLSHIEYPGRIFYKEADTNPCITYDSLRYFLKEGYYIIYNNKHDTPPGEFIDSLYFRLLDLWTNNPDPQNGEYWHKYQIIYGTPIHIPPID